MSDAVLIQREGAADRRWDVAIWLLFVTGVAIRVALYFPIAAFPGDSDATLTGLCAFHVLDGNLPAFTLDGTRHGSITCYLIAALMQVLGPGRISLAIDGLIIEILLLFTMMMFLRKVLSPPLAALAMLFVIVPAPPFLYHSFPPYTYGETFAACAAVLYFAACFRQEPDGKNAFLFGFLSGLAMWFSFISLMIVLPASLWSLRKFRPKTMLLAAGGAFIGFLPWTIYNVTHGYASLITNWASQPTTGGPKQALSNLYWQFSYNLPALLTNAGSQNWGWTNTAVFLAYVVAAAGLLLAMAHGGDDKIYGAESARSLAFLGMAALVMTVGLNAVSFAGSVRGSTVRYITPFYLVIPPLVAIGLAKMREVNVPVSAVSLAVILGGSLMTYSLPGTALRQLFAAELETDKRVMRLMHDRNIEALFGDYWLVYHLNFDSQRRLVGVPPLQVNDYYQRAATLPPVNVRWAFVARDEATARRFGEKVGATGEIVDVDGLKLLIPDRTTAPVTTDDLLSAVALF